MNTHLVSPIPFKGKHICVVSPHPDDDALGCGALLYYLTHQKDACVTVAYAVSGFNGVSDRYLQQAGIEPTNNAKAALRKQEATKSCDYIGATPVFWDLPFYEQRRKIYDKQDVAVIDNSIQQINPDIIFVIDEDDDPHGTHGIVKYAVLEALATSSATVLGYRVWKKPYESYDIGFFFHDDLMKEKEQIMACHQSQLIDPSFPCQEGSFLDMMKRSNRDAATFHASAFSYAECYKILKI